MKKLFIYKNSINFFSVDATNNSTTTIEKSHTSSFPCRHFVNSGWIFDSVTFNDWMYGATGGAKSCINLPEDDFLTEVKYGKVEINSY